MVDILAVLLTQIDTAVRVYSLVTASTDNFIIFNDYKNDYISSYAPAESVSYYATLQYSYFWLTV